uniref:Putative secreted protein n=1 Tax=Panstrongylus lignarius TaxID=156445 RepID=A0A224Y1G8_9HEMI
MTSLNLVAVFCLTPCSTSEISLSDVVSSNPINDPGGSTVVSFFFSLVEDDAEIRPSGCLAWYIQRYFLKPFNANTVPTQFLGLIDRSLSSTRLCLNTSVYQLRPLSRFKVANINVLFFLYGQTHL